MRNALALMISSGGSAVLGLVFWILAAHVATTTVVGKTTAAIAAMLLLATLAQLSFGSIFERFLPVAGDLTRSFVRRSYVLTVTTAVILTVGYIALGFDHRFLPPSFGWKVFFVAAVVLWAIFALQDSVLVGLRASKWVAVENIGYGIAKLALLPVFVLVSRTQGIFIAWTIPVGAALVGVSWYLFRHRIPSHMAASSRTEDLPTTRELIWLSSAQYASLLSTVFLPSIVTLIVIVRLGAVSNAYYYLPAMIATNLQALAFGVVRSFLVEASSEPHALKAHADSAIRGLAAVMIPCVVLGIIFAPVYLRVFGDAYARHGTDLMRMLLLSLVGTSVMIFYSTFAWLDKRLWWITARNVAFSAIYLIAIVALIGRLGINAIGVASLIWGGLTVAIFLPASINRYRRITTPVSATTE